MNMGRIGLSPGGWARYKAALEGKADVFFDGAGNLVIRPRPLNPVTYTFVGGLHNDVRVTRRVPDDDG